MADWSDLRDELDRWQHAGLRPRLWWRDDDAQAVTPALDLLLSQSDRHGVPVHLSVIPEGLHPDLAPRLDRAPRAWVLQHGLRHRNHEPKGSPASEVGATRPLPDQVADLRRGWALLAGAGLPRLLPALVPPWNRIGDETRARLPDLGYSYLSSYEGRGDAAPVPGLFHLDAHLDPIRWKKGNVFRGAHKMLDMLIDHLAQRRTGAPAHPVGLVTHHLQTGDDIWAFTDRLFAETAGLWHDLPALRQEA
ncbi:polysaccharide deacetylase family protein [Sulfitobacter sp. HNIBRBA3233]|uniref:polysaccharide deacetylase family protein n=1 Tax=Sulfitobacter marinivivus TaxID=3158558 RepID=UPI0032E046E4